MKTVYKPWGREEWLELNDRYCYKRIYINAGHKTSYQYHNFKRETNFLISGEAEIWLENDEGVVEKKIMKAGEYFNVTPPKKHRVIAITDIILQEVSTPEVDDVIRIEDDTNRKDGKIDGEHKTPAVLILAAGKGTRLGKLTENINKALIPINNKAIISYIIEQFPVEYEIIIAIGYQGQSLKEYCEIAHPDRKFQFVEIENYEIGGPGNSAFKCKELLQRPFYLTTADCILKDKLPLLDGNWLGTFPTSYPEKYSTLNVDANGNISEFINKWEKGFENAFIGIASIWDYEVFWKELGFDHEVVKAFDKPRTYPSLKAKQLGWLDTGNLDDLNKAKEYFDDKPLSLYKETSEITYKIKDKFIKFNSDKNINKNKAERAKVLVDFIPKGFGNTEYFIYYNWEEGETLYNLDQIILYKKFFHKLLDGPNYFLGTPDRLFNKFYIEKTNQRKDTFIKKFGKYYNENSFEINGKKYPPLKDFKFNLSETNTFYTYFHGDCQFDNIVYNLEDNNFTYIDWRESFGGNTKGGDYYYDLAKMYAGCIIPFNLVKDDSKIYFKENSNSVEFKFPTLPGLNDFKKYFEQNSYNLDFKRIKLITAIIFLNMSPLHSEKFGKALWFKAIEMLYEYQQGH
jgi:dTDP-glucose pyrophosphorylase/mannose-6-phosphate isomerase-like protein (cupin superfamily)